MSLSAIILGIMPLFSWSFWFATHPIRLATSSERWLFVAFSLVALLAIFARLWARQDSVDTRIRREVFAFSSWYILLAILGYGWLFLSAEEIQFFGWRAWFLVWLGGILYLTYRAWHFVYVDLPGIQARRQAAKVADKYQPRRVR